MTTIRIIALQASELKQMEVVCRFINVRPHIRWQLVAPIADNAPRDFFSFERIELASLICEEEHNLPSDVITVLCNVNGLRIWNSNKSDTTPRLCIHKNMAIMEIQCHTPYPDKLTKLGYKLCILANDNAINHIPNDICYSTYPDLYHYHKDNAENNLLLTANHQMLNSLISMDSLHWTVIYPEYTAIDLLLDLCDSSTQRIIRELNMLQELLINGRSDPSPLLDVALIRQARNSDNHSYSFFADNYDQYMAHVDYDLWIGRVLRWYKIHSPKPLLRILEMACGTANVSSRLVAQGYHVDASDLSINMLAVADTKPFKPHLYRASLVDPIPGENYNLIICMFDSINYLLSHADLTRFLEVTFNALDDQGILIFDISTRLNSEENFEDVCSLTRSSEGMLVHHAWFEDMAMLQKSSLRFFRNEMFGYSQQHELHTQRVYLCTELIEVILGSRLTLKAIYSLDSDRNLYPRHVHGADDKYTRLFFVLSKEKA